MSGAVSGHHGVPPAPNEGRHRSRVPTCLLRTGLMKMMEMKSVAKPSPAGTPCPCLLRVGNASSEVAGGKPWELPHKFWALAGKCPSSTSTHRGTGAPGSPAPFSPGLALLPLAQKAGDFQEGSDNGWSWDRVPSLGTLVWVRPGSGEPRDPDGIVLGFHQCKQEPSVALSRRRHRHVPRT